jgi:hypothetical protein
LRHVFVGGCGGCGRDARPVRERGGDVVVVVVFVVRRHGR